MKILITAFGSFPGVEQNPTETLLKNWDSSCTPHQIVKDYLPVEYAYCEGWKAVDDVDLVIHLGVAVTRDLFSLERCARNFSKGNDAAGAPPTGVINEQGEATLTTGLKLDLLRDKLDNFSVEISDDAGQYLCNYIYYQSLQKVASGKALFVHTPPLDKIPLITQDHFLTALVKALP
jgi:pyroglutamyl-peptidase